MKKNIYFLICSIVLMVILTWGTVLSKSCCVTCPNGKVFCKNDFKYFPPDFPDNIFLKYACSLSYKDAGKLEVTDEKIYYIALIFDEKAENVLAISFSDIITDTAWAFIECEGDKMTIIWIAKHADSEDVMALRRFVNINNQKNQF